MTLQPPASQLFASALAIPLFLQRALDGAGFKELTDFDGVATDDLCRELKIGTDQAEDLLRQVESFRAGPSRSRIPPSQLPSSSALNRSSPVPERPRPVARSAASPPAPGAHVAQQIRTANANSGSEEIKAAGSQLSRRRAKINATPPRGWTTGCKEIDRLIDSAKFIPTHGTKDASSNNPARRGTGKSLVDFVLSQTATTEISPPDLVAPIVDPTSPPVGVQRGMVLEIASPPGGGKTSLVIGLAVEARRTAKKSDAEEDGESEYEEGVEVLIVDTEGSITASRISEVAEAATRSTAESATSLQEGIHLMRLTNQTELVATLNTLDEWLEAHNKVKLVIIDTLSFHLRHPSMDLNTRKRITELVKQRITKASTANGCAIVIANQMATKLLTAENKPANFDTGDKAVLMPQLGDGWVPPKALRLSLFRSGPMPGRRFAHLQAVSPQTAEMPWAPFDISSDGLIQDVMSTT